jgi:hypothetical protein
VNVKKEGLRRMVSDENEVLEYNVIIRVEKKRKRNGN